MTKQPASRWPRRFVGVLAGLGLSACDDRCAFETVLDRYEPTGTVVDCGDLPLPPLQGDFDDSPWHAARACVLAAASERMPFRVTWQVMQIEGVDAHAFVGDYRDDRWMTHQITEPTTIAGTRGTAHALWCMTGIVEDSGPCGPGNLCLRCGGHVVVGGCE